MLLFRVKRWGLGCVWRIGNRGLVGQGGWVAFTGCLR
jgi:hypothetical protein